MNLVGSVVGAQLLTCKRRGIKSPHISTPAGTT